MLFEQMFWMSSKILPEKKKKNSKRKAENRASE